MSTSIERALIGVVDVVAQACRVVSGLEAITRPPRLGHDVDVADGAAQLAEREAEEEVSEPAPVVCLSDGGRCECDRTLQGCIAYHTTETKLADLEADRGTGAINDGEPQLVTLSGREYERYLGGALNEPFVHVAEVCRAHQAEECWVCDEDNDDLWVHPRDVDTEPDDDSLACPYPDCARYVDHRGPHEFPWGDSIPWPPEADLNDDVTPNTEPGLTSDELVGVRGLLQERYEPPQPWPCPVDDCEFEGSSCDEVNIHSYFDHLQPNPFEVSTDPLVEYKRYPGLTKTGDFRWFNVKVTKSSASVTERWLTVPDWEGYYEASDTGRIRSVDRLINGRLVRGKILSPYKCREEWPRLVVKLARDGARSTRGVGPLVLSAFVGACPPEQECCHGDGDYRNNNLSNLRWDTHSANMFDQVRHGTHPEARRTHCSKDKSHQLVWIPTKRRRGCPICIAERERARLPRCADRYLASACNRERKHPGPHEKRLPDGCVIARWTYTPISLDVSGCIHAPLNATA